MAVMVTDDTMNQKSAIHFVTIATNMKDRKLALLLLQKLAKFMTHVLFQAPRQPWFALACAMTLCMVKPHLGCNFSWACGWHHFHVGLGVWRYD